MIPRLTSIWVNFPSTSPPFGFGRIPKKILSPKNVDFFLDMLENVFLPPRLLALSLEVKNPGKMNGWEPPNNGGGLVGLFR